MVEKFDSDAMMRSLDSKRGKRTYTLDWDSKLPCRAYFNKWPTRKEIKEAMINCKTPVTDNYRIKDITDTTEVPSSQQ